MKFLNCRKMSIKTIKRISILLNNGFSIKEITYFYKGMNIKDIEEHLDEKYGSLSKKLSIKDYFSLVIKLDEINEIKNSLILKKLNYPMILFAIVFMISLFFKFVVLEQISSSFFDLNITKYMTFLNVVIYVYGIIVVISIVVLVFLRNRIVRFIMFEVISKRNSFISKFVTYRFVSIYGVLSKAGYKSSECLKIIKELKKEKIISNIAYQLDVSLEKGMDIKTAMDLSCLDSELKEIFNISDVNESLHSLLSDYSLILKYDLIDIANFYSKTVLFVSYVVISIIVIFMYQVLITPLQMVNSL